MNKDSRIYIAGHSGLVGSAIVRNLQDKGFTNLTGVVHNEDFDLTYEPSVDFIFRHKAPEYVFIAAAKVGGIKSNKESPADYINDNLRIVTNLVNVSYRHNVKKLIFLGSVCAYPKEIYDRIKESDFFTGKVEETSEFYALAKIAGIKLCQAFKRQYGRNFISAIPANTFGVNDNFHPDHSHVVPAMISRFHEAKIRGYNEVVCWGSGRPMREFLYVDDVADAIVFLMENYDGEEHINVGGAPVVTMKELAENIAEVVKYKGKIVWDTTKPDGMMYRRLDAQKIQSLGWKPKISLLHGLEKTYNWYLEQPEQL